MPHAAPPSGKILSRAGRPGMMRSFHNVLPKIMRYDRTYSRSAEENAWPVAVEGKADARSVARSVGCGAGSGTARSEPAAPTLRLISPGGVGMRGFERDYNSPRRARASTGLSSRVRGSLQTAKPWARIGPLGQEEAEVSRAPGSRQVKQMIMHLRVLLIASGAGQRGLARGSSGDRAHGGSRRCRPRLSHRSLENPQYSRGRHPGQPPLRGRTPGPVAHEEGGRAPLARRAGRLAFPGR